MSVSLLPVRAYATLMEDIKTEQVFFRTSRFIPAVEYINANLPYDATVFLMFIGRRSYYLDRPYKNEPSFGMKTTNSLVKSSRQKEVFHRYVQSMGVTHLLVRKDLFDKYLADNFSEDDISRLFDLIRMSWRSVYDSDGYVVWDVVTKDAER